MVLTYRTTQNPCFEFWVHLGGPTTDHNYSPGRLQTLMVVRNVPDLCFEGCGGNGSGHVLRHFVRQIIVLVLLSSSSLLSAVDAHGGAHCGTPNFSTATMERILDISKRKKKGRQGPIVGNIIIDTYITVVTDTRGSGDVSNTMIQNQMNVLNSNFANSNSPFRFQMKGVQRYQQPSATTTFLDNYINSMTATSHRGGMDALNIFIVPNIYTTKSELTVGQALPFFSLGSSNKDGVYILYDTLPGGSNPYDRLGIVTVHEVGHWLGLIHVFQNDDRYINNPCNPNNPGDYIADTPQMASASYGCEIGRDSCPSLPGLDPVNNFMSYSFDADGRGNQCRTTFTPLQVARMIDIWSYYRVQNQICAFDELQFELQIRFDNSPQTISWDIKATNGTLLHSSKSDQFGYAYDGAFAGQTLTATRCLGRQVYIFDIYDSAGNGIASPGYYQLRVDGAVVARGGQDFGSFKSFQFGSTIPPTSSPTPPPTRQPTTMPTPNPTNFPTTKPTRKPTKRPTSRPTRNPTHRPTKPPTKRPTTRPTQIPTQSPTVSPSLRPTTLTPSLLPVDLNITVSPSTLSPTSFAPTPRATSAPPTSPPTQVTLKPTVDYDTSKPSVLSTAKPSQTPSAKRNTTNTVVDIPIPAGYCFSAHNMVEVQNRGLIFIGDIQIGDLVKDAFGNMVRVYSFGHYHKTVKSDFLQIHAVPAAAAGENNNNGNNKNKSSKRHSSRLRVPIEISKDHLIFVNGEAIPASQVRIGDKLHLGGESDNVLIVSKIKTLVRFGAFAPFTTSGTIEVSGVAASSYVTLQANSSVLVLSDTTTNYSTPLSMHWLAHVFQSPHRLLCLYNAEVFCHSETYTNEGISMWVQRPLQFSQWLVQQRRFIMIMILVPGLCLGLLVYAVEIAVVAAASLGVVGGYDFPPSSYIISTVIVMTGVMTTFVVIAPGRIALRFRRASSSTK